MLRSDVLRADLLDQAVLESLLATYADSEVVSAAIERWRTRAAEQEPDTASQVRRVEAEISGTQSALERYYSAFENGRLSESRFGSRVDGLERRLIQFRAKLESAWLHQIDAAGRRFWSGSTRVHDRTPRQTYLAHLGASSHRAGQCS
jgi:hypothetical protein